MNVFILEDSLDISKLVETYVSGFGHFVRYANNYDEAINITSVNLFDVIISDYNLDHGNDKAKTGLDFITYHKKISPQSFCILLTAFDPPRFESDNADLVIRKPLQISILKEALDKAQDNIGVYTMEEKKCDHKLEIQDIKDTIEDFKEETNGHNIKILKTVDDMNVSLLGTLEKPGLISVIRGMSFQIKIMWGLVSLIAIGIAIELFKG